ncbi:MAG: twin-arginine translocation signal domain-containing protein, partial [Planctomycetota bacterium]
MSATVDRRSFLGGVAATAAGAALSPVASAAPTRSSDAERAVVELFKTLTPEQRRKVAFAWDHIDKNRGLLRTFVSNNWQVTQPHVISDFYS